jgi:hypothetical protein
MFLLNQAVLTQILLCEAHLRDVGLGLARTWLHGLFKFGALFRRHFCEYVWRYEHAGRQGGMGHLSGAGLALQC